MSAFSEEFAEELQVTKNMCSKKLFSLEPGASPQIVDDMVIQRSRLRAKMDEGTRRENFWQGFQGMLDLIIDDVFRSAVLKY